MTLNGPMVVITRYFTQLHVKFTEARLIVSVTNCSPWSLFVAIYALWGRRALSLR